MNILLQTTIEHTPDDWHIGRFSLLAETLRRDHQVTARNLQRLEVDSTLANLDPKQFDQVWILAVDGGDGLNSAEIEGLSRYWSKGGGLLIARDHADMGACLFQVGPIGQAHHFHSTNPDPDEARRCRDDAETMSIDWPNYHSGRNGDFQRIEVRTKHPLLWNEQTGRPIEFFPAHPHEGSVGEPPGLDSRLLICGTSAVTGNKFGQVVAFENTKEHGRGIAQSSFHHFADYNWDPRKGCPSFVVEKAGDEVLRDPEKLGDIRAYVANVARWLGANQRL